MGVTKAEIFKGYVAPTKPLTRLRQTIHPDFECKRLDISMGKIEEVILEKKVQLKKNAWGKTDAHVGEYRICISCWKQKYGTVPGAKKK